MLHAPAVALTKHENTRTGKHRWMTKLIFLSVKALQMIEAVHAADTAATLIPEAD
jgi:hypothetical protein